MSLPAQLQTAFSSLQQELEKYIRDEVQRQVKEALKGGGAAPRHEAPKKFKQEKPEHKPKHEPKFEPKQNIPAPQPPRSETKPTPPPAPAPTVTASVAPMSKPETNRFQTAQRLLQQISTRKNLPSARPA